VRVAGARMTCGVVAVISDGRGHVLVVRHTYRRPAWGLPGGLLGYDEQPAAALSRELHEELGVRATVGPLAHAESDARRRHLTLYYRVAIDGEPQHGIETDAHRYSALDELPDLINRPVPRWLPAACRIPIDPSL